MRRRMILYVLVACGLLYVGQDLRGAQMFECCSEENFADGICCPACPGTGPCSSANACYLVPDTSTGECDCGSICLDPIPPAGS